MEMMILGGGVIITGLALLFTFGREKEEPKGNFIGGLATVR
jgi:hypothetical protein